MAAQEPIRHHLSGQLVVALTGADPVPGGDALTELRVVQPALMLRLSGPARLGLLATLNLEGATIPSGELTPGTWGEGLIDRRHPHTYVHELMLTADDLLGRGDGPTNVSLAVGKGFAPFGTDDPMSRPVLRYPVNHHFAQILERAVAVAAVRRGPLRAELGLFNGDEPERPGQWPRVGARFGDSWSAPCHRRADPRPGAAGLARPGPLARASAGRGDGSAEVEPVRPGRRQGGGKRGVRHGRMGTHLRGGRLFRLQQSAGGRCMDPGPPPSPLSVRADRAAGGAARVGVPLASATPGELDPGDHALEHPHLGIRPAAARAPWSHGRPGGRSVLRACSRCPGRHLRRRGSRMGERTSGVGPWESG